MAASLLPRLLEGYIGHRSLSLRLVGVPAPLPDLFSIESCAHGQFHEAYRDVFTQTLERGSMRA